VTQLGMSDVGTIAIDQGGMMGPSYSEELGANIDEAIRTISDECYLKALAILSTHRACLDRITDEFVEVETLSGERLREIVAEYMKSLRRKLLSERFKMILNVLRLRQPLSIFADNDGE